MEKDIDGGGGGGDDDDGDSLGPFHDVP